MAVTPIKIGIRPPRIYPNMQALHCIRMSIGVGPGRWSPRANTAIPIGTVPAGSFIRAAAYSVSTSFAPVPSTILNLGTSDTVTNNLIAAGTLAGVGYFPSADAMTGLGYSAEERVIYLTLGAKPDSGAGEVIVLFYPYRD